METIIKQNVINIVNNKLILKILFTNNNFPLSLYTTKYMY